QESHEKRHSGTRTERGHNTEQCSQNMPRGLATASQNLSRPFWGEKRPDHTHAEHYQGKEQEHFGDFKNKELHCGPEMRALPESKRVIRDQASKWQQIVIDQPPCCQQNCAGNEINDLRPKRIVKKWSGAGLFLGRGFYFK